MYENIEPFGELRMDLRFAQLASVVANAAGKPAASTGRSHFTTDDFMLDFARVWADLLANRPESDEAADTDEDEAWDGTGPRPLSPDEVLAAIMPMHLALGGAPPPER